MFVMNPKTSASHAHADTATHSQFQLAYDGRSVADGTMDVRDLAPALAALGELLNRSNDLLNGESSAVTLRVVAGFDKGSFDVNLLLDQWIRDPAVATLPTLGSLSAQQILDIVLGTYDKAKGVITGAAKIYKAAKGERPTETKQGINANTNILVFGSNNTIITDPATARLYNDERVRDAITRAAEPLLKDGVDNLKVKRSNRIVETLERPDVGQLSGSDLTTIARPEMPNPSRDIWVRVVKPNFDGGRWSFHDGSAKFGAELEDKAFQARVNSREQGFFAGDTFLVRIRSEQHIDKKGNLTTRNVVEKVLDFRRSPRQHPLNLRRK